MMGLLKQSVASLIVALLLENFALAIPECANGEALELSVLNGIDTSELADSLACSNGTQYLVDWRGKVEISRTLAVGNGCTLIITGKENAGIDGGGAIQLFAVTDGGTLQLQDIFLEGGWTSDGNGGAVSSTGSSNTVNLLNCTFENNTAGNLGGAVYVDGGNLTLVGNSVFSGNTGSEGGAIAVSNCESVSFDGDLYFAHNKATAGSGGGISITDSIFPSLKGQWELRSNTAYNNGGGIYVGDCQFLHWDASMILTKNLGERGGGVYIRWTDLMIAGDWRMENNTAHLYGGGLRLFNCSNAVVEANIYSTKNTAIDGGAVHFNNIKNVTVRGDWQLEDNLGTSGSGGLRVIDCPSVTILGDLYLTNNNGESGGGFHISGSNATITGNWQLDGNAVTEEGGGIRVRSESLVRFEGDMYFVNHIGERGGGIHVDGSTVYMTGRWRLDSNTAVICGGGLSLASSSSFIMDGSMQFTNNNAAQDGGAVCIDDSTANINGSWQLDRNTATLSGGAILLQDAWSVTFAGDVNLTNNEAQYGGSLHMSSSKVVIVTGYWRLESNTASKVAGAAHLLDSSLYTNGVLHVVNNSATTGGAFSLGGGESIMELLGTTVLEKNQAKGSGGALYIDGESKVLLTNVTFVENIATQGDGGAIHCASASALKLVDVSIRSNEARNRGGGLVLAVTDEAVIDHCRLEDNSGIFGGGIYSSAGSGSVSIVNSTIKGNSAVSAGGGLYHSGNLKSLDRTIFEGNTAQEGPAAFVQLGDVDSMSGTTFDANILSCAEGTYAIDLVQDSDEVSNTCRFEQVCYGCSSQTCDNIPTGVMMEEEGTVPFCMEIPNGATASDDDATVESLQLELGYFRVSNTSGEVRECYRKEACKGGTDMSDCCAQGYLGPYCAACETGYAAGFSYSCRSCVGRDKDLALGLFCSLLAVALALVVLVVVYLLGGCDQSSADEEKKGFRAFFRKSSTMGDSSGPTLTSIKIVVVVWQIVNEFQQVTGVKYPGIYTKFLSILDFVDLNLGFILSFACVVPTDFYDRLLFATLCPAGILAALALVYIVASRRRLHSPSALRTIQRRHLSVALLVMFWVYSSVSHTIFQTFACDLLDNRVSYLRADYSLLCSTPKHRSFTAYAAVMAVIYPLGVPITFSWWLLRNRKLLSKRSAKAGASDDNVEVFRDLWEPYRARCFFYEIVEYARRILLTGLSVFIFPGSSAQVAIVLLLATAFSLLFEMLSPFRRWTDAWLYRAGNCVIFLSMYLALLLKVDVSKEENQSQVVFAGLLIAGHVVLILAVILQSLFWVTESRPMEALELRRSQAIAPVLSRRSTLICHEDEIMR